MDLSTVGEEILGMEESMIPQLESEKSVNKLLPRGKCSNELMSMVGVYEYVTPISLVEARYQRTGSTSFR